MYYSYQIFLQDTKILKAKVDESRFNPEALLCIARGGMSLTHTLSLAWNIRDVYSINAISYTADKTQHDLILSHLPKLKPTLKRILILDETIETGASMQAVLHRMQEEYSEITFQTACLVQKEKSQYFADFYVRVLDEWVDFYWEVDILENKE